FTFVKFALYNSFSVAVSFCLMSTVVLFNGKSLIFWLLIVCIFLKQYRKIQFICNRFKIFDQLKISGYFFSFKVTNPSPILLPKSQKLNFAILSTSKKRWNCHQKFLKKIPRFFSEVFLKRLFVDSLFKQPAINIVSVGK